MGCGVGTRVVTNGLIASFDVANGRSALTDSNSVWMDLAGGYSASPSSSPTLDRLETTLGSPVSAARGGSFYYNGSNQFHQIQDGALNVPYYGKTLIAAVTMGGGFKTGLQNAPNYGFRSIVGKANSNIGPTMVGRNWNLYVYNDNASNLDTNFRYHFQNWALSDYVSIRPNVTFIVAFTQMSSGEFVFYHNGLPCGSGNYGPSYFTQYMYDPNCPERIGTSGYNPATNYDSGGYWLGYIHHVSFYNRALTQDEITTNYRVLRNRMALSGSALNPVRLREAE